MELAIIIAIIIAVAIYYGLFDSVETGARMANRKIERLEAEQINEDIRYYNTNSIDANEYEKAVEQKSLIKTYRNM